MSKFLLTDSVVVANDCLAVMMKLPSMWVVVLWMVAVADVPPNTNYADRVDDIKPRRRDGAIHLVSVILQMMCDMNTGPLDFPDWLTRRYLCRCCPFVADNLNGRT